MDLGENGLINIYFMKGLLSIANYNSLLFF